MQVRELAVLPSSEWAALTAATAVGKVGSTILTVATGGLTSGLSFIFGQLRNMEVVEKVGCLLMMLTCHQFLRLKEVHFEVEGLGFSSPSQLTHAVAICDCK